MKFEQKKAKFAFFENVIFAIFWASRKWKKSNHQKCENFIKRPYFFIAAYQRRVLNDIFGPPEPLRKFFFSDHQDADSSKFPFFAKHHEKNNVFAILEISQIQKSWFSIGFSIKMNPDKNLKKTWIFAMCHFCNFEFTWTWFWLKFRVFTRSHRKN